MNKLLVLVFLGVLAWYGYGKFKERSAGTATPAELAGSDGEPVVAGHAPPDRAGHAEQFSCDGRTYCSQMRSCAEATWFIQHCPGTKMDGNNDGVPCERQWCG
ncbi:MAG: excalibur calcium-binding domain-containing protein [Pseudoxanthomonas sp.]|nr:excalibur calcium-binding domain-containing protein [Pseudoxanthomonas sp.]